MFFSPLLLHENIVTSPMLGGLNQCGCKMSFVKTNLNLHGRTLGHLISLHSTLNRQSKHTHSIDQLWEQTILWMITSWILQIIKSIWLPYYYLATEAPQLQYIE
jgi:hypothetical protein